MCRSAAGLVLALLVAPVTSVDVTRSSTFLAVGDGDRMRPELVARTLLGVEDEWKQQAIAFTECNVGKSDCNEAPVSFASSCATVISAVVQGSGGNRAVAKEYMTTVCNQKILEGWHKLRCADLSTAIVDHAMTADNFENRESLSPSKLCSSFWFKFVDAEQKREAVEAKARAEREAKEAKERAEREKREAAEAAEAKKKAEAEAKAAAERRAKEEALHKKEEKEQRAKHDAQEAKARAAAAAAKLAQKRAEAEAVQKAAQQKLEEAAKAEKEHLARQAEHEKAEELLRNATQSATTGNVTKEAPPSIPEKVAVKDTKPTVAAAEPAKSTEPVAKTAPLTVKLAAPPPKLAEPVAKTEEPKADAKAMVAPKKADAKANSSAK